MRVLMITDNYYLEEVNGVYYHRYIDEHIKAYSLLGDIKLLLPIRHEISVNRPIDLSQVSVRAIDKEKLQFDFSSTPERSMDVLMQFSSRRSVKR